MTSHRMYVLLLDRTRAVDHTTCSSNANMAARYRAASVTRTVTTTATVVSDTILALRVQRPEPRLGNGQTGRQADCGGHTALRDERCPYPLLPADSHPRSLAPRPQPIPRQVPTAPPPVPKRLNSILQIRRRQQSPHELVVI